MLCAVGCFCFLLFFFQAEDGIRDLVRSRGLGDVYKRQIVAVGHHRIEEINIREASRLAMRLAVARVSADFVLSLIHI